MKNNVVLLVIFSSLLFSCFLLPKKESISDEDLPKIEEIEGELENSPELRLIYDAILNCDCDQIEKQIEEKGFCDNPDCKKLCEIDNLNNKLNEAKVKQCLGEDKESEKTFKEEIIKGMANVPSKIAQIQDEINSLEEKDTKLLKENCPSCRFSSAGVLNFDLASQGQNKCSSPDFKSVNGYYLDKYQHNTIEENCAEKVRKELISNTKLFLIGIKNSCSKGCSLVANTDMSVDNESCFGVMRVRPTCSPNPEGEELAYKVTGFYKRQIICGKTNTEILTNTLGDDKSNEANIVYAEEEGEDEEEDEEDEDEDEEYF